MRSLLLKYASFVGDDESRISRLQVLKKNHIQAPAKANGKKAESSSSEESSSDEEEAPKVISPQGYGGAFLNFS